MDKSVEEEWLQKQVFFESEIDIIFNSSVIEEWVKDFFPSLSSKAARWETIFKVHLFNQSERGETIIETFEQVTGNEKVSKKAVTDEYSQYTKDWFDDMLWYLDKSAK